VHLVGFHYKKPELFGQQKITLVAVITLKPLVWWLVTDL
jgi:hypothetical protein